MTPEEIKKVLAMPEEEQEEWVSVNCDLSRGAYDEIEISLEELAVRLWDEVASSPNLYTAMLDVHQEAEGPSERSQDYVFWSMRARPIHKILAAMQAKEGE